jgi:hypothetical protein
MTWLLLRCFGEGCGKKYTQLLRLNRSQTPSRRMVLVVVLLGRLLMNFSYPRRPPAHRPDVSNALRGLLPLPFINFQNSQFLTSIGSRNWITRCMDIAEYNSEERRSYYHVTTLLEWHRCKIDTVAAKCSCTPINRALLVQTTPYASTSR